MSRQRARSRTTVMAPMINTDSDNVGKRDPSQEAGDVAIQMLETSQCHSDRPLRPRFQGLADAKLLDQQKDADRQREQHQ